MMDLSQTSMVFGHQPSGDEMNGKSGTALIALPQARSLMSFKGSGKACRQDQIDRKREKGLALMQRRV